MNGRIAIAAPNELPFAVRHIAVARAGFPGFGSSLRCAPAIRLTIAAGRTRMEPQFASVRTSVVQTSL
jgi:hypothetical protein